MRILSISKTTTHIAYAMFEDTMLFEIDTIYYNTYREDLRLKMIYDKLSDIVKCQKIDILATHMVDYKKYMKKELRKIFEIRAILQLVCANYGVIYTEFKTDGWEYYITKGRNTPKKKLDIINKYYELDLEYNKDNFKDGKQDLADAIILGEGVAHKRLQIGR